MALFLTPFLFLQTAVPTLVFPKELPVLIDLSELSKTHDGKRITVFAKVLSAEVKTGRRGSLHLELVVGKEGRTVRVYTIKPISNIINRRIIIQGIYHEQGRFAGHKLKQFIEAGTIVLDQSETRREP
ncbi:MAG: hypothetical protein ACE5FY_07885 [Nitrospiria bacterium]